MLRDDNADGQAGQDLASLLPLNFSHFTTNASKCLELVAQRE